VIRAPSGCCPSQRQPYGAGLGKLDRVREQILQDLLQTLCIGQDRVGRQILFEVHRELEVLAFRYVSERTRAVVAQLREPHTPNFDVHLAGFDLAEIENVVDKSEQIGPRGTNGLGVLDLLVRQALLAVFSQHLSQNQQVIERRAKLVAHVRQEFALVLRRDGELLAFSSRAAFACSTSRFLFNFRFCSARSCRFLRAGEGGPRREGEQLAVTSKYKSEFLANMSHELRTPLNNLLILAQMLAENSEKSLTNKQVQYAETIRSRDRSARSYQRHSRSQQDRIRQDGRRNWECAFTELRDYCSRTFRHVAEGKNLEFTVDLEKNLPADTILTDTKRLQQVLKNLLSNAIKFTETGSVRLTLGRATTGWSRESRRVEPREIRSRFLGNRHRHRNPARQTANHLRGLPAGGRTTSRRYGGTGLGLSISRELARLLGGEIRLQSTPGIGSTFTLYLPQTYAAPLAQMRTEGQRPTSLAVELPAAPSRQTVQSPSRMGNRRLGGAREFVIEDDRNAIRPGDPVLLIVEDNITFARILLDLAHERGLKALVALRGGTALSLAREFIPGAITLDIVLPDMAGWTILDRLKHDPATRHIPVHVISAMKIAAADWLSAR